jgi:hypothetical protein
VDHKPENKRIKTKKKKKNGFLGGCSGGGQTTPNLSAWGGLATPTHLFWVVQPHK